MKIYDSHKKEKVPFEPIIPNEVRLYVCGPTVYDDSHLGHARSAIVFDLLRRVLIENGYKVIFAKNFTDIDDKIINKATQNNCSIEEITQTYTKRYLDEMQALGVMRADIEPKATENLEAMFAMIQNLLDKKIAYQTPNGDVYLSVSKDREYGNLSGRIAELESQSRVQNSEQKHDSKDFALWKSYKGIGDVGYDSPFGKGRPGWHIECSAMIKEHLALKGDYAIDIHGGGTDLLFPHHENEACQTRCADNQVLAKYWIHNGFVTINGEKMAKSLGNSFFIKDALANYDGEILRFYLLSTHYRAGLNFSEEDLLASKKRLDRLYRLKKRLAILPKKTIPTSLDNAFKTAFLDALNDDLNISKALSVLDDFIANANEQLDSKQNDKIPQIYANLELVAKVLGIGIKDCFEYFKLGVSEDLKTEIENLLKKRAEFKKIKDFQNADKIREELRNKGIEIMDTPNGCIWEKI
ncbi:cysteine--tRNA ligase [Helicobacter winghamensis]|uniref:Cysteine--tRNA ligase n=1 Tax=Helicobacter winghamensis TaxID=157268 RepID=A0A2N3PJR3_9HELI|nr:cysteine--tRNA ligase [Helicobacter winghamensis]EEO26274.1 cysteine--tRNA ligase [Helicobacter winghamensis ATCC BAA-430]PKT77266.1 cysteine--tRNA ligase [Helicobacter winghamensis]PKT77466.1 cysteine--tRNA ligase [Helicobacter winghamensis]PKT77801.1 cysteine--tRNA ligase [Helicobacter winghamensis]PKT81432.1 cysteine--tRNA ligase [Helicobacter winghamensis]